MLRLHINNLTLIVQGKILTIFNISNYSGLAENV